MGGNGTLLDRGSKSRGIFPAKGSWMPTCSQPAAMFRACASWTAAAARAALPHAGGAGAGYVLGVDNCPPMIEAARELQSGRDEYLLADAQDLSFLAEASFDLVVSYLNQCDLPISTPMCGKCSGCSKLGALCGGQHPSHAFRRGSWLRDLMGPNSTSCWTTTSQRASGISA